jgi:hypothetical protein
MYWYNAVRVIVVKENGIRPSTAPFNSGISQKLRILRTTILHSYQKNLFHRSTVNERDNRVRSNVKRKSVDVKGHTVYCLSSRHSLRYRLVSAIRGQRLTVFCCWEGKGDVTRYVSRLLPRHTEATFISCQLWGSSFNRRAPRTILRHMHQLLLLLD